MVDLGRSTPVRPSLRHHVRPEWVTRGVTLGAVMHCWVVIALTPAWTVRSHLTIAVGSGLMALLARYGITRMSEGHKRRVRVAALAEMLLLYTSLLRVHRVPERAISTLLETAPPILHAVLTRAQQAPVRDGEPVHTALRRGISDMPWTQMVCAQVGVAVDRADPSGFERAVHQILSAETARLQTAADRLQLQLTVLFLLGVFGPLAAVGLLPAASAGGVAIAPPVVAVIYHLWVPIAIAVGVAIIITGPLADLHPIGGLAPPGVLTPKMLLLGVLCGVVMALVGSQLLPWAGGHLAVATVVGVVAHTATHQHIDMSRRRMAIDQALPAMMATLGVRLSDGGSPERALAAAADPSPLGRVLARVDDELQEGASLPAALDAGLTSADGGPRLRRWATHYRIAAGLGTAGGALCSTLAEAWRASDEVRGDAMHQIGGLARMCTHTGVVVGPIIAGTTVAMLSALTETALTGRPLSPTAVGPPVATTVLSIAVLLPSLAVMLEHGPDLPLVLRQAGHAAVLALVIFVLTVSLVSQLL